MNRERAKELFECYTHFMNGGDIEVKLGERTWYLNEDPSWSEKVGYRIAVTKPSINWDHVHEDYNYLIKNEYDSIYVSKEAPRITGGEWCSHSWKNCQVISSVTPGTCDWKDSLVERPKSCTV